MSWQDDYKSKLCTAAEAVKKVKSGDRIIVGHACGEPTALVDALVANSGAYHDVEIYHMVAMGKSPYCQPEYAANFHHNSNFLGGSTRKCIEEGRGDFTPCNFSDLPGLIRDGYIHPNVAFINVSPPDKHGWCSYGVSVDYTSTAAECAEIVIAQVNKHMPRTFGTFINVSDIDYIVEADQPLIQLPSAQLTDVDKAIGANCASLIKDGDTLQLGIGSLPDAVLFFLKEKHDLGIHSEMFSDGVVELVDAGVITNKKKNFMPGKFISTFLMGTDRLYNFVDDNPAVSMQPVDWTNDPRVIAQNDNLISINSCIQVDLSSQIASDTAGLRQISGIGGQMDFVRGANMSRGGKSIIAMPSTTGHGKISKIVPFIDQGGVIAAPRPDVNYIITEYGICECKGRTVKDRARQLIKIAHPDFRDGLIEEFEKRFKCKY
ncbi:MAG: 4-hydroxybutyrate CoA-transferase [Spirochaetaceae bacterium]|jgi:4-hydroxybutyrate CoA-transferase|nr:4-hydroxybutyrate CoA-transferase [Spirochaetaceae bacterium]